MARKRLHAKAPTSNVAVTLWKGEIESIPGEEEGLCGW